MQAAKVSSNARQLLEAFKTCHKHLAKLGKNKHGDAEMRKTMKQLAALVGAPARGLQAHLHPSH